MSFGHLISGFKPVSDSIARRNAVAEATVNCVASGGRKSGRSKMENHKPLCAGEIHFRPSRPRPFCLRFGENDDTLPSHRRARVFQSHRSSKSSVEKRGCRAR
jgi:hypothetical protein